MKDFQRRKIHNKMYCSGTSLLRGRRCLAAQKTLTASYFLEQCSCPGYALRKQGFSLSMSIAPGFWPCQRKRGKGCLYRQTSSPGLTPTRRRSVGRQGAPSPRLVVMPWRREMNTNNLSTSRWTTAMRSVMAEKIREAKAHSPKRWAATSNTSSNQ